MKLQSLLTGILLLAGGSVAQAVPYTDIYDIFQTGYNDGGTMSAVIKITDVDGNGLISAPDTYTGSMTFRREGPLYLRSFDLTGITGLSLLSGAFSITGLSHLGGTAIISNTGGSAVNYDFPLTGQFSVSSTTQAPVVTKRVPDGGSTLPLLLVGLLSCRWIKSRQSKGSQW